MGRQTALITGGGGFIGRACVRQLVDAGYIVFATDREVDVRNPAQLDDVFEDCSPDVVIHLAGVLGTHELFDHVEEAIDVNVKGTVNVLDACRKHGASYVGVTMPQVFPSIYTATKMAATRAASAYHHSYGVPVSHVRAYNAFGPGQAHGDGHPQKILPTFAVSAWRRSPIPVWGDGKQGVDLIYTDELARVFAAACQHGDDCYIDGGTGIPFTVNDVALLVNEIAGNDAGIRYMPMRRGEIPTAIVAEGEGWNRLERPPRFDVAQIRETVLWYRDHPTVTAGR